VSRHKAKMEATSPVEETIDQIQLCDTYTSHEYEIILDVLYGLFSRDNAEKVRVFDPFVADPKRAPLVTPPMLTERLESLLNELANAA
jgi:hypothetical protein